MATKKEKKATKKVLKPKKSSRRPSVNTSEKVRKYGRGGVIK